MTKKAEVIIKKDGAEIDSFYSKTLTKRLNKLAQGTVVDVFFKEDGYGETYVGNYPVKGLTNEPEQPPDHSCAPGMHWDDAAGKCVVDAIDCPPGQHFDEDLKTCVDDVTPTECPPGQHFDPQLGRCVDDVVIPEPEPTGDVLYDSLTDSNLHDGKEREFTKEGDISPGGKGIECHASGNPRIHVNTDKTFSLLCDKGHGRFYGFVRNYNATLEVEAAWWNDAPGQDCSQKERSQHNEKPKPTDPQSLADCSGDAFGGYGFSFDRTTYDAKREPEHNFHDQPKGGSLGMTLKTKEYWKSTFTVKDENGGVRQIGTVNGKEVLNKLDSSPLAWMKDPARYARQSYFWIRQNITSGTGELRIKRVRVLKA